MGWIRNVCYSLSDSGGVISQEEATDEEIKKFLKSNGINQDSVETKKLENSLKDSENKPSKMQTLKSELTTDEKNIKGVKPKGKTKKESTEKEMEL